MKFRKKPVVIEAVEWTGENHDEIHAFAGHHVRIIGPHAMCQTLEGAMTAVPGNWIIKGIKGEFYPCRADIFALTYEPVEEPAA